MVSSAQWDGGRVWGRRCVALLVLLVITTSSALCLPEPPSETLLLKLAFEKSNKRDCCGHCREPLPELKRIVRATPAGNLLWNSPVPPAFSPRPEECEASSWVQDWHDPNERRHDYETLGIYFAQSSDTLAFATHGNVFALSSASGKLRFEWAPKPARGSEQSFYYFDDGTFQVRRGNHAVCAGKAGGARVFAPCENEFFYFDHEVAAVIDSSGRVIAETAWQDRFRAPDSTATRERARIPLGPYQLLLEGMTFLR